MKMQRPMMDISLVDDEPRGANGRRRTHRATIVRKAFGVIGRTLLKVYVPTPPNPTSGFVYMFREEDTRDPGWTVEEALQCILSGGLIGPDSIR